MDDYTAIASDLIYSDGGDISFEDWWKLVPFALGVPTFRVTMFLSPDSRAYRP